MDVMHERVAGLDVHKANVVACVRIQAHRPAKRECRTFATTTDGLRALLTWLSECRCTRVAMEATGVYWMPVWKILSDGDFELIVANAAHIKNVPGRKTDLNDAMWIADLVACGLIGASFVPHEEMQELRALMRTRKQLTREQTRHVQRLQKTLTEANIHLDQVICDIVGASGRRIGDDRRGPQPEQTRSARQQAGQSDAEGVVRCAAWPAHRSSPLPARASSSTMGCFRHSDPVYRWRSR
jgi:transposase